MGYCKGHCKNNQSGYCTIKTAQESTAPEYRRDGIFLFG